MRMPSRVCEAQEVHTAVQTYVSVEISAGRLKLSARLRLSAGFAAEFAAKFGLPLLALLLPFLDPLGLILAVRLRRLEKTDPELCFRVDQEYSDALARLEDHDVSNQFTAMGSLKPGDGGLWTAAAIAGPSITPPSALIVGDWHASLSIHFARWVFLDDKKRLVFSEATTAASYMDDFINRVRVRPK